MVGRLEVGMAALACVVLAGCSSSGGAGSGPSSGQPVETGQIGGTSSSSSPPPSASSSSTEVGSEGTCEFMKYSTMRRLLDPPHYRDSSQRPDTGCHYYFQTTDKGNTANSYTGEFIEDGLDLSEMCTTEFGGETEGVKQSGALSYCSVKTAQDGDILAYVLIRKHDYDNDGLTLTMLESANDEGGYDLPPDELEQRCLVIAHAVDLSGD